MTIQRSIPLLLMLFLLLLTGCKSNIRLKNWKMVILKAGYGYCQRTGIYEVFVVFSAKNIDDFSRDSWLIMPTLISPDGSFTDGYSHFINSSCYTEDFKSRLSVDYDPSNFQNIFLPGEEKNIVFYFQLSNNTQLASGQMFRLRIQERDFISNTEIPIIAEKIIELPIFQELDSP